MIAESTTSAGEGSIYRSIVSHVPSFQLSARSFSFFRAFFLHFNGTTFYESPHIWLRSGIRFYKWEFSVKMDSQRRVVFYSKPRHGEAFSKKRVLFCKKAFNIDVNCRQLADEWNWGEG